MVSVAEARDIVFSNLFKTSREFVDLTDAHLGGLERRSGDVAGLDDLGDGEQRVAGAGDQQGGGLHPGLHGISFVSPATRGPRQT